MSKPEYAFREDDPLKDETQGDGDVSQHSVTPDPHDQEREQFAAYGQSHSKYAHLLQPLYEVRDRINRDYFGGHLKTAHITFGPARRLFECARETSWGADIQYTIHPGLVDPEKRHPVIINPLPAAGTKRLIDDGLLRLAARQYVIEEHGTDEAGYRNHGPLFVREANRIGNTLSLMSVVARRRDRSDEPVFVASQWPWIVRPDDYYGGDVALQRIQEPPSPPRSPDLGQYQYMLYLFRTDPPRLGRLLEDQVERCQLARSPALRAVEDGRRNWDGTLVPAVEWDERWASWNGGCLELMARHILHAHDWGVMPILGDALQDAGCGDPFIIGHCMHPGAHTRNCWVLRNILQLSRPESEETTDNPAA